MKRPSTLTIGFTIGGLAGLMVGTAIPRSQAQAQTSTAAVVDPQMPAKLEMLQLRVSRLENRDAAIEAAEAKLDSRIDGEADLLTQMQTGQVYVTIPHESTPLPDTPPAMRYVTTPGTARTVTK